MIRRFPPVSILPPYFRHRPPMSGIPRTSPPAEHPAARGEYSTASPVASRGKLAALLVLLLLPGLRADTFFSEALGTSPAGWSMTGQWAFGQPAGQGGTLHGNPDPDSGYTGSNVCGVNLSGDYSTAIGGPYFLTSPPIDCSGWENVHLKYRRWLNTDYPPYVDAAVEVSTDGITWTEVYHNPPSTPVSDSAWQEVDIDISVTADGAGALAIRWCYGIGQSGAYAYSGWNIDDISLTGVPVDPLAVSPADDTAFECTQGKPESVTPGSVQYSLQNTGTTVLHWSAAAAESWVEAFPPRGTLAPGGQVEVTVRLTCTAWQLPQSSVPYSSAVVFTNLSTAETTTRQAALEVSSPPAVLDIDSGEILFWVQNGGTMTRHLSVGNAAAAGGDGLQFSVTNLIRNVMTDTVGTAAYTWTGTNRYRGNLYEVTADTVLTGVETWLSFTGQVSLNCIVLESATRTGVYSKVADQTVARMGTGAAFYASDSLEAPFTAGHYYIVATGWTDSVGYSADTSPQPNTVSFGSQLGGYTYSGFPMPSSVSNPSTSYNNYCQRLTTGGGWLTVTPESGDLQPGDSTELVLEAGGGTAATYSEGELLIESNDPEAPEAWIRCRLATGAVVLLDIPETAREENGVLTAQGCIRLPSPSAVPVQVGLVSDQPGTVAVPAQVTVPAGETAVRFDIQITDDSLPEEALTVTVTASASGYADSRDTITVRDDEPQRAEVTTAAATAAVDEEIGVTVTILNSGDEPVLDFDGSVQFGLVHPPHTVRVLSFVKYADTSATGEYQHTLDALGSYFGIYEESATSTTDPAVLATELSSADVFLIVDQESASAGELEALGTSWSTVLSGFCESGGVVVACSGYTTQQSEHTILENSGLLSADKSGIVSSA